jgi:hypothetical protein
LSSSSRDAYAVLRSDVAGQNVGDTELLQEILRLSRLSAQRQLEALRMQFLQYREAELGKPRYAEPKRLLRSGFKLYSQNDEDGILEEIFRRIGHGDGRFVEFGVQNGFECNSAKLLIEGWQGLWIELNAQSAARIREHFHSFIAAGSLMFRHERVTAENIDALLVQTGFTGDIDFLSIDIDFNDYWVWKAVEAARPRVVSIEYNASLRPPLSLVVPYSSDSAWNGGNYFGASLEALVRLAAKKGYRIVGCCFAGVNAFFVREDLCGDLFLDPATSEEHYEPPRYFANLMTSGHSGRPGRYVEV